MAIVNIKSSGRLDRHSPRITCAKRDCERLSASGNFCLDGRFPETCMVWVDVDSKPALPRIQCGNCGHVGEYRDFVSGTSRSAMRHPDHRYCPSCHGSIDWYGFWWVADDGTRRASGRPSFEGPKPGPRRRAV